MFTDRSNPGSIMACKPERSLETWTGASLCLWMVALEKCSMFGLMLPLAIFPPPRNGPKRKTSIGNPIGNLKTPNWYTLSEKTILFFIVLFSLSYSKIQEPISFLKMFQPMNSSIWRVIKFPLPKIGQCGCTSIWRTFPTNKMCCDMR